MKIRIRTEQGTTQVARVADDGTETTIENATRIVWTPEGAELELYVAEVDAVITLSERDARRLQAFEALAHELSIVRGALQRSEAKIAELDATIARRADEAQVLVLRIEAELEEAKRQLADANATIAKQDAALAEQGNAVVRALEERNEARARAEASDRELERWRHGNTIESDFVCPNELRAVNEARNRANAERERDAAIDLATTLRNELANHYTIAEVARRMFDGGEVTVAELHDQIHATTIATPEARVARLPESLRIEPRLAIRGRAP